MSRRKLGSIGSGAGFGAALWLTLASCAEPQAPAKGPDATVASAPATATTPGPAATPSAASGKRVEAPAAPENLPDRAQLLALRDAQGGAGLLALLARLPADPGRAFAFQKQVFDLVGDLNDPGAADALVAFLAHQQHPYFETRAALALAALADLRAVPFLAKRLRLDPLTTYGDQDWELRLKRDDNERVKSARLLADLAALHPQARASIAAQAEDALWFWLHEQPSPHANGMRALANLQSQKNLAELRTWSNPQVPLPLEGQQPPMPEEWVIAQSGLRYVGKLRDLASFSVLLQALQSRPQDKDLTMDGLSAGGVAILGMSVRALGIGAADGLAEWGDARAFQPLVAHIEDSLNNEHSRLSAGTALGWVGTDKDLQQLAKRVAVGGVSSRALLQRACFIEGLRARPVPGVAPLLLPMLDARQPHELRLNAARAIGRNRLDPATQASLIRLLQRPELQMFAALALLLGGSPKGAVMAVQSYGAKNDFPSAELLDAWFASFGTVSTDDVANGTLFRYIENADAVAATRLGGPAQLWAPELLGKQLENIVYDNGPHTVTRVVLNDQLRRIARGSDLRLAGFAVRAFTLLNETGQLLDLSRGTGPLADSAARAYRERLVRNAAAPQVPLYD